MDFEVHLSQKANLIILKVLFHVHCTLKLLLQCTNHTHFHLQSKLLHLLITERLNCHRKPGFAGAPLSKSKVSISKCPFSCAMYTGVVKRVLVFTFAPLLETGQDFLYKLGMKSHMLLVEKTIKTLLKGHKILIFKVIFQKISGIFLTFFE